MTNLTTGVHTSVVDDLADLVSTAVSVVLALHLGAAQGLVGVADMFVQTPTLSLLVHHLTLRVGPTLGSLTGVDTLPVAAVNLSTGQTVCTVSVSPALIRVLTASSVGVSDKSLLTAAHRIVVNCLTHGCRSTAPGTQRSTGVWQARVCR